MYYKEYGNKNDPLMLFLHGGGVSSWMCDKQIQHFSNYYRVVVDLPTQGKSSHLNDFSIKTSAEMIINLIQKLTNNNKVIVIGFSLGAQVIVQMLSMTRDLIDYAMINSALVRPNPLMKKWISPSLKLTYPLIKVRSFAKLQSKALYISNEDFDMYFNESSKMKLTTLVKILEENMIFKIPPSFKEAKSNILVTVGEKEKAVMKKSAKDMMEENVNCESIIISDVGHGLPMAEPKAFNEIIDCWLKEKR